MVHTSQCGSIEKRLLPNKFVYFTFCAGFGVVTPFMSVFFKQLGFSPEQIGLISGLRPVVGCLFSVVIGALADKYTRRKFFLLSSLVGYGVMFVVIYLIQEPARVDKCPNGGVRSTNDIELRHSNDNFTTGNNTSNHASLPTGDIGWLYPPDDVWRIFCLMLFLILCSEMFQAPTISLTDAATLHTLGRDRLDEYGRQRAWGSVGWGLSSFLVGALLNASRQKQHICGTDLTFADYRLIAYIIGGDLIFCVIATTQLRFETEISGEHLEITASDKGTSDEKDNSFSAQAKHDTWTVFRIFGDLHFGSWLVATLFAGMCNGVIWGFLYWHLENLGADQLMMAVCSMTTCTSEFVFMMFVNYRMIDCLGHMGVMYLGLAGFAVRFGAYSVITNPWYVLLVEPLHGITFASIWISLSSYTARIVPAVSLATTQGIIHGVYLGLGNGGGFLLGGVLTQHFSARWTFAGYSVTCLIVLLLFLVAQKMSSRRTVDSGYRDIDKATELDQSSDPVVSRDGLTGNSSP